MSRFLRTERLLGKEKLELLQNARVTVVGLGAVGSYVVEGLARSGVGTLRIVDFDEIKPSNINRQLYALDSTVGKQKVQCAQSRIQDINPGCCVETLSLFASEETCDAILNPRPAVVVDAIDSLNSKVQLMVSAHEKGIPIISSMGAALRTDPTRIRVGDVFKTRNCPLAKFVRKRLRRRGITDGIRCVYSDELRAREYEVLHIDEGDVQDRGRPRTVMGSMATITGMFGLRIAHEVIDMICGQ